MNQGLSDTSGYGGMFPFSIQTQANKSSTNGVVRPGSNSPSNPLHILLMNQEPVIKEVWEDNFEEEIKSLMNLIEKYNIIGMDTEFPGVVYRTNEFYNEIEYRTIKMNADKLKLIQVGISIASEEGLLPEGAPTWQFNFKFDRSKDEYAEDAIELLENSGIQFDMHAKKGINPQIFAEYLISSGLVLNEDIKWITFHGGFDFAYLIRILNGQPLPDTDTNFYKLLSTYFPQFFDVKYMVKDVDVLKGGGLQKLAGELNVKRYGPQHQAGSDSLLTLATYFKLKDTHLKGSMSETRYSNVLHGISSTEGEDSDYGWHNSNYDYNQYMYNNFAYMNPMTPMMNNYPYQQHEGIYNIGNTGYNNGYVGYNNYQMYMENNQKNKKYDVFQGKAKS